MWRRWWSCGPGLVLLAGVAGALAPRHSSSQPATTDTAKIYLRDCAICHGARGTGSSDGPDLRGLGPALVDYELTTGRMPLSHPGDEVVRRPPRYDATTIDALVEYVASIAPGGPAVPRVDLPSANLPQGGADFRLECAACHQAAGQGGTLRYGEAPSLHDSTPVQVVEAIMTGPGTMPKFGAFDNRQMAGIAAYVEYLRSPVDRGGQPLWHFGPLAEGMVAFIVVVALTAALLAIGERR